MISYIFAFFSAIGGYDGQHILNSVERFDPRVGTWEYAAPMSDRRYVAGAAILEGKIYVTGGHNESYLNIVDTFLYEFLYPF